MGTTNKGIGPTYASKALRMGLRIGDLSDWDTFLPKYERFIRVFKDQFNITEFDQQKELDELRAQHAATLSRMAQDEKKKAALHVDSLNELNARLSLNSKNAQQE